MPSSFKGTTVTIEKIAIVGRATGAVITMNVQFMSDEGVVHATTSHSIEPSIDPNIATAVTQLLSCLQVWVEKVHFTDAAGPQSSKKAVINGIAETLRDASSPDSDLGTQG